ncbi:MAG: cyclic nucleotide-binding domain-containing protein [Proteobacteria bacterium]|nr:cyclic nucleotide-binding domain-containing protein [Pseudomonadota bacterium]
MPSKKQKTIFNILEGLNDSEKNSILSLGQEVTYNKGASILIESVRTSEIYIIMEGRVSIDIGSVSFDKGIRAKIQLAVLRQGDIFGEMAFLENQRRTANVTAIDKLNVIKIDRNNLLELFDKYNYIGYIFMRNLSFILSQRLEDANFMLRDDIKRFS